MLGQTCLNMSYTFNQITNVMLGWMNNAAGVALTDDVSVAAPVVYISAMSYAGDISPSGDHTTAVSTYWYQSDLLATASWSIETKWLLHVVPVQM